MREGSWHQRVAPAAQAMHKMHHDFRRGVGLCAVPCFWQNAGHPVCSGSSRFVAAVSRVREMQAIMLFVKPTLLCSAQVQQPVADCTRARTCTTSITNLTHLE